MKKNFSPVFFFCFCTFILIQNVSFSQSAWTTQYLNNVGGNQLRRVQFVNKNVGWACGGHGTLIKTTDGGCTWNSINTGSSKYLTCIYFIDENTGWVGSEDPCVKRTTNGGLSWYSAPIQASSYSADFFFLNSQTGFITSHDSKIYKTTDGGLNWNLLTSTSKAYGVIQFINENTGWVISDFALYKTTDGGIHWTPILYNFALQMGYFQTYFFLNAQTGWVTIPGGVSKSTDGGCTWSSYTIPIQTPYALKFFDKNVGWCAGKNGVNGVVARTLNGGVNWTIQSSEPGNVFWDMCFINPSSGWLSGNSIISSTQNGNLISVSQISTAIPEVFSLKQNYPNPFNPATKISFDIKKATFASLKVFNMNGKEVKTLVNEDIGAGRYEINFNAEELNSGVYFYTLKTNEFTETKKMMLVK